MTGYKPPEEGEAALLEITEICGARSFARHHTGPHGILWRANLPEQGALVRPQHTTKHVSALTSCMFDGLFHRRREATHRIKTGVLFSDLIAASWNDPDAAPGGIAGAEDLIDSRKRNRITLRHNTPSVGYLDLSPALMELPHDHGDTLEDIVGLEPCDQMKTPRWRCISRRLTLSNTSKK